MKHLKILTPLFVGLMLLSLFSMSFMSLTSHASAAPLTTFAADPACPPADTQFFILWPWYHYFIHDNDFSTVTDNKGAKTCELTLNLANTANWPKLWLIALVVFEDLLRVSGIAAIGFIIYGGIRYVTSQGEPENTRAARETIINALIGMTIALVAAVSVSYLGTKLGAG